MAWEYVAEIFSEEAVEFAARDFLKNARELGILRRGDIPNFTNN